jgi:hypothetical protein
MTLEGVEVHQHQPADPEQRQVLDDVLTEGAQAHDEDLPLREQRRIVPGQH